MFNTPAMANSEPARQTIPQSAALASWFVLRSKPQKEEALSHQILARGLEVFYPSIHVQPVNPRSRSVRPFFPGYLFVHINLEQTGFSEFHWTPFSLGLVAFDGIPAQVSEAAIQGIRSHLEKINAPGRRVFDDPAQGELVAIKDGPFAGYEAIFDMRLSGNERVRVLLKLLQQKRQFPLELSASQIQRIDRP